MFNTKNVCSHPKKFQNLIKKMYLNLFLSVSFFPTLYLHSFSVRFVFVRIETVIPLTNIFLLIDYMHHIMIAYYHFLLVR